MQATRQRSRLESTCEKRQVFFSGGLTPSKLLGLPIRAPRNVGHEWIWSIRICFKIWPQIHWVCLSLVIPPDIKESKNPNLLTNSVFWQTNFTNTELYSHVCWISQHILKPCKLHRIFTSMDFTRDNQWSYPLISWMNLALLKAFLKSTIGSSSILGIYVVTSNHYEHYNFNYR